MAKAARRWKWMVGSVTLLAMIALVTLAGCGGMDWLGAGEYPVEPSPNFVPGRSVTGPNVAVSGQGFRPAWAEASRPNLGVPLEALPRPTFPQSVDRPELSRPLDAERGLSGNVGGSRPELNRSRKGEPDIAPMPAPVRPSLGVSLEAVEPAPRLSRLRPEFGDPRNSAAQPPMSDDPRLELAQPGGRSSEECQIRGEPHAMVFTSTKPGTEEPSGAVKRYSIYSTSGVFVGAYIQNLCGAYRATFEVWAPDGSLFKRAVIDFEAAGKGLRAMRVPGGYLVGFPFPISGTPIAQRPIVGAWSVNFGVGDSPARGLGLFVTHP